MEMKFWGVQEEPENEKAKRDKCGTRREWNLLKSRDERN